MPATLSPLLPAQEEIAFKAARLQRVAKAAAAARQETAELAAEFQGEREKLLDDIRHLSSLIKQKAGRQRAVLGMLCWMLWRLRLSVRLALLGWGIHGVAGPAASPLLACTDVAAARHALRCLHAMPCPALPACRNL